MLFALSKKLRGSISVRIAFLFSLTFSLGLMLAFAITYFKISYSLEKNSREVLSAKLNELSAIIQSEGITGLEKLQSLEKNRILNSSFAFRIITTAGETLYTKSSEQEVSFDFGKSSGLGDPSKAMGWQSLPSINDEDRFTLLTERINPVLYIQVGKSSEDGEDILDNILRIFIVTGGLLILLSGWLGTLYARKSLAPVRALLDTVKQIEKGDLSKRVVLKGSEDELRYLGEAFNRMVDRVEKLVQVMKESLDNVAHDIRTPLTRIRAVAEDAILSGNPENIKEALGDCAESAADISGLADQLMSISEAEAGTMVLHLEKSNIKKMAEEIHEVYEFVAQEKQIKLHLNIDENLTWNLDRKRIKQALANLIDNAIKFSLSDRNIFTTAKVEHDYLIISVRDQGSGINKDDLNKIWDRLFRGDRSRTHKGLGLGLSIVRSVTMAHGGLSEAKIADEGGMIFTIQLPYEIQKTN